MDLDQWQCTSTSTTSTEERHREGHKKRQSNNASEADKEVWLYRCAFGYCEWVRYFFFWSSPIGFCLISVSSFRKTIIFQDANQKPLVLLATHAKVVLKALLDAIVARIQAIFPGELFSEDSTRMGFQFLALHFGWYMKYSESVCPIPICYSILEIADSIHRERALLLQMRRTLMISWRRVFSKWIGRRGVFGRQLTFVITRKSSSRWRIFWRISWGFVMITWVMFHLHLCKGNPAVLR